MADQREEGPRVGAAQRSARQLTAELAAFCREQTEEFLRYAIRAGLRREQAEDVVQTVWLKHFESQPLFTGDNTAEQERAWFATVTQHEVANLRRQAKTQHAPESVDLWGTLVDRREEEAAAHDARERQRELFRRWRKELHQRDRLRHRLVYLRHVKGLSPAELAKRIGRSAHWVSVQINRALNDFRDWLRRHREDEKE